MNQPKPEDYQSHRRQSGQVAILTVVIFMILFSVLVVSFTRIMVAASRQTVSDELRAKATSAAESGIEDAKRVLTYCLNNLDASGNFLDLNCQTLRKIGASQCSEAVPTALLSSKLKTEVVSDQVKVGNDQEYYLCLIINALPDDIVGQLSANGESVIIPLRFRGSDGKAAVPNQVTVEWHIKSIPPDGDGSDVALSSGTDFPSMPVWLASKAPAVVRLELATIPKSGFNLQTITDNARAVTLRPSSGGANSTDIDAFAPKANPNAMTVPLFQNKCNLSSTGYVCSFTFSKSSGFNLNNDYYLRLQSIYRSTHYRITAKNTNGPLYFDGVQAKVDVTGRAQDSYQRLQARVQPVNSEADDSTNWWPEYAIDSGGKVCKKMSVALDSGSDDCDY
jgi:hypothetical protein